MGVREESDKYLASIAEQQTWIGNEPGLQLLLLPLSGSFALPKYSSEPDYLSLTHCCLCLSGYEVGCEEQHLQECSQCTTTEYRRLVLRKVLEEWPQRISAQVLRSRLAAFKSELCDANFEQLPCASCCRLKRRCKLSDVIFPPANADEPPAWLACSTGEWVANRAAWFRLVDEIFNINSYMENFFHTQERLSAAREEANSFEEGSDAPSSFSSASAAQSWIRRVEAWISNLRRDLETDSLPAPGLVGERWLVYSSGSINLFEHWGDHL